MAHINCNENIITTEISLALTNQIIGSLSPVPVLVAIHCIISANDTGKLALTKLPYFYLGLVDIFFSTFWRCIATI